jgi:transcriptional regulator with XRE-family HTH domain
LQYRQYGDIVSETDVANMRYLAELIQSRRESAGLKRAELARLVGVDWRTLWRWETGKRQPRGEVLERLLRATVPPAEKPVPTARRRAKTRRRGMLIMDESRAKMIAKALHAETWQSGGGIWLVIRRRADGHLVVISEDTINEYENEEAFEASEAANFILLA